MAKAHHTSRILNVTDITEVEACSRLRHRYFVIEKKWVPENPACPGIETDFFDSHSLHLAVLQNHEVIAYLRVLPHRPEIGFMIDRDFACLLNPCDLSTVSREGAVELSRLVCRSDYLGVGKSEEPHPVELLLKLLYQESKTRGFNLFYIVVEEAWLRPFARRFGLPFRVLGQPYTFPDGTRTVAAVATLEELEAGMKRHSAAKYEWYQHLEAPVESKAQ